MKPNRHPQAQRLGTLVSKEVFRISPRSPESVKFNQAKGLQPHQSRVGMSFQPCTNSLRYIERESGPTVRSLVPIGKNVIDWWCKLGTLQELKWLPSLAQQRSSKDNHSERGIRDSNYPTGKCSGHNYLVTYSMRLPTVLFTLINTMLVPLSVRAIAHA
jgi:hypothetical protein